MIYWWIRLNQLIIVYVFFLIFAARINAVRFFASGTSGLNYLFADDTYDDVLENQGPVDTVMETTYSNVLAGLVILDFESDDDLDIFVVASEQKANFFFRNDGSLSFTNIGNTVGIGMMGVAGKRGACAGDIDNDGDTDIFVVTSQKIYLFKNNGNSFTDISNVVPHPSVNYRCCSTGDVNHDGYLDLFVSTGGCGDLRPNIILISREGRNFVDETVARGLDFFSSLSWVVALVDYDGDGDLDAFSGNDGCAAGDPDNNFLGYMELYENTGRGNFRWVTDTKGVDTTGGYMGLSFADFDHNGDLDVFITDLGHWLGELRADGFVYSKGSVAGNSRWFLNRNGFFSDPGVGSLGGTPFGWATVAADFNNDGFTDVLYHGGMVMGEEFNADNPGVLLLNDGNANFVWDSEASNANNHIVRDVKSAAVADLNRDGYPDIVSVSITDFEPRDFELMLNYIGCCNDNCNRAPQNCNNCRDSCLPFGTSFDDVVGRVLNAHKTPFGPDYIYEYRTDITRVFGSLKVELNEGNRNNLISVQCFGSAGVVIGAVTPRDGIGAVIKVTPSNRPTQMIPVTGGDSTATFNDLRKTFGLGTSTSADVEIVWPTGLVNKLCSVSQSSIVLFPEMPCNIFTELNESEFAECIDNSLDDITSRIHPFSSWTNSQISSFRGDLLTCWRTENPPTEQPTQTPTDRPTEHPTDRPTEHPTDRPTESPSEAPTEIPTEAPTEPPDPHLTDDGCANEGNLDRRCFLPIFGAAVRCCSVGSGTTECVSLPGCPVVIYTEAAALCEGSGMQLCSIAELNEGLCCDDDDACGFDSRRTWSRNECGGPTEGPTETPTETPTEVPTEEPTEVPTEEPTGAPTEEPTEQPTEVPTEQPTEDDGVNRDCNNPADGLAHGPIVDTSGRTSMSQCCSACIGDDRCVTWSFRSPGTCLLVSEINGVTVTGFPGWVHTVVRIESSGNGLIGGIFPRSPGKEVGISGSTSVLGGPESGDIGLDILTSIKPPSPGLGNNSLTIDSSTGSSGQILKPDQAQGSQITATDESAVSRSGNLP